MAKQAAKAASAANAIQQSAANVYHSSKPALKAHLLILAATLIPLLLTSPVGGSIVSLLIPDSYLASAAALATNISVVVTAALAVYAGCWRSVKPEPPAESMSKSDAMRFPVVGSAVLFGLFIAFKFLPKELVNFLLTTYIAVLAVVVLTSAISPYVEDWFPAALHDWSFTLPKVRIPHVVDLAKEPVTLTGPNLVLGTLSAGFCGWYIAKKHWIANNVLGLALSLEGIEHLSLGSVHVGCILLVGLFFYDIFWVFCTPVMVSVAKNFDAPIKLLFPRLMDAAGKRPFSMLGLGDIVIPGIFVALMLRMDVHRNLSSSYFRTCFLGYVLGLGTTILVMNVFNAAQPALLYIVPACLGTVGIHAWSKGEFMQVFNFSEAAEDKADSDGKQEDKKTQ